MTSKKLVDKNQAYFWTKAWQQAELEAEQDIKTGRVVAFGSAKALLEDLDKA